MYTWINQYGNIIRASTRKELVFKAGGGKVSKMYVGDGLHIGYVIGDRWWTRYEISPIKK